MRFYSASPMIVDLANHLFFCSSYSTGHFNSNSAWPVTDGYRILPCCTFPFSWRMHKYEINLPILHFSNLCFFFQVAAAGAINLLLSAQFRYIVLVCRSIISLQSFSTLWLSRYSLVQFGFSLSVVEGLGFIWFQLDLFTALASGNQSEPNNEM